MRSLHQSVWKKAGIDEAIMNSTYTIIRNDKLVFGFAERWCSETNTFVFPWGETTITLEDIMILGGYSVLGDSVSSPLESREMEETQEKLLRARTELTRSKANKACQHGWMSKFMASGSDVEHEAFLTFWLSRFVFFSSLSSTIGKDVIPIAIHLAKGTRIALAPAVLASLYKDLSFLKEAIVSPNRLGVTVCAPLQYVQIWAWERFLTLQPNASSVGHGEPRLARWEKAKKVNIENIRLTLDSAGEYFLWRPYAANNEKGEWLLFRQGTDEKMESLALCLRVCELVGHGARCIEQYLPHRVARQFGLDQDLPGPVARFNATPAIAWRNYKRPIKDKKLYIPPRHCEPGVTNRYLELWNKIKIGQHQQEANSNSLERTPQSCKRETDPAVPPGSTQMHFY
ncbi:serine/threonine-protein phosphatase 7 long form homolog [Cornus florida]|uniref:serine/threonine-protein phosphatase 7 long form homolog n=1 Tax=Cornus florida TaxID=4283 RepID=UPI00289B9A69|nr:serine/threonine-protein phosphatase 7 long form homolog [Cornus florida]